MSESQDKTPDRIVRVKEAVSLTGLSAVSLWRYEKAGNFPPRRKIGPKAAGYLLSEVMAWLNSRPATK